MSIKAGSGSIGGNYLSQLYLGGNPILSQEFIESFSDGIGLVDVKTVKPIKLLSDTIGLTDPLAKLIAKMAFVESIVMTDIGSIVKVFIKILVDGITMVEEFSTGFFQLFSRIFTDTVAVADTWSRKLDKLLAFVDNISITEIVSKVLPHKRLTDQIQASDSLTFAQHLSMILTDTISAIDNIAKKTITAFSDGIGAIDLGFVMPIKNFVESISLSDSFVKSVRIILRSAIGIVDTLARRLNGMLINWEKRFTDIKDWTKRVTQVVETTKVARMVSDWTKRSRNEESFTKTSKEEDTWTKFRGER